MQLLVSKDNPSSLVPSGLSECEIRHVVASNALW